MTHPVSARHTLAVSSVAAFAFLSFACSDEAIETDVEQNAPTPTIATWSASPQDYAESLPFPGAAAPEAQVIENQTLRQTARVSAGGDAVRVQLSNLFGTSPLVIDSAAVALSQGGGAIDAASSQALRFGGAARVTLAPGEERWSDVLPFVVPDAADLAVSLYLAGATPVATTHSLAQQTAFLAAGDVVAAASLPTDDTRQSYYWLSRIDVQRASPARVIVAFGDSITDGFGSTPDQNHRYPNYLSERFRALTDAASISVVNAGISGNRVLNDAIGPSGVSRFARDALGQSGVTDVIILLGINDTGFSGFVPEQDVSADAVIQGLSAMLAEASAAGVRPFLATLLPLQGTMAPYYSEASEAKRQAINAWIRSNEDVAGVVDFDVLMQDPANPLALLEDFDSGDNLHPNDAGYAAMADAIDASWFE